MHAAPPGGLDTPATPHPEDALDAISAFSMRFKPGQPRLSPAKVEAKTENYSHFSIRMLSTYNGVKSISEGAFLFLCITFSVPANITVWFVNDGAARGQELMFES